MGLLTIVGLGPGGPEMLTREAEALIAGADELYVRTRRHPTVAGLPFGGRLRSFDSVYRRAASIDDVYSTIADRLLRLARRPRGVIYAVPGHPLVGERSVALARERAAEAGVPVRVVAGLSFVEPTLESAGLDPLASGLQILDAHVIVGDHFGDSHRRQLFPDRHRWIDPTVPAIVAQVESRRVAGDTKLALLDVYPPDHVVVVVRSGVATRLPLVELDRVEVDHLSSLVIPPIDRLDDLGGFETLRYVVGRLRAPSGCPWDREQTHASLKGELVEETYEAVDAIDHGAESGDWAALAEELGDLLMLVLLHAQIASEGERFSLDDVLRGVNAKLVRRHPHVFGEAAAATTGEVLLNWDRIKRAEKEGRPDASRLGELPRSLPALARAQATQRRARRTGFVWSRIDDVWAKLEEEIAELRRAEGPTAVAEEMGDLLWMVAELAGWLSIDAEEALRQGTTKFARRFQAMEQRAAAQGQRFEDLDLAAQLDLWSRVKQAEGVPS